MIAYLLPYKQKQISDKKFSTQNIKYKSISELFPNKDYLFFESGKKAIHYIISILGLQREDEVYIDTTSNSSFVTTCVSATIFNYCKISRVLTEKTKLIWVIHEFGFPNKRLEGLLEYSKTNDIPTVEDSAHSLNGFYNNHRLGTRADFGLYSLPKSFPIQFGGLLIATRLNKKNCNFDETIHGSLLNRFNNNLCKLIIPLGDARRNNYFQYLEQFKGAKEIFQLTPSIEPFVFGFLNEMYKEVYDEIDGRFCELARTYVNNWLLLPVNSYIEKKQILAVAKRVKAYACKF